MVTIITIIGRSGAGKDEVVKLLSYFTSIPVLCSYTTRPMRPGEKDGREHYFVRECTTPRNEMLAYTRYGDYEYWTEKGQLRDTVIYVIDEKGFLKLCETVPNAKIIAIYVSAKTETLKRRDIAPERMERDAYRVKLDIDDYDFVIPNNSTRKELQEYVAFIAHRILHDK